MKYVDASAVLRVLFAEPGPSVPLVAGEHVVSSRLIEVEAFRAADRERLLGGLSDAETAIKRMELFEVLAMADLAPVDSAVIDRAKGSFAVNLRAFDAIHVATAELLAAAADGEPLEFWTHDERQATAATRQPMIAVDGRPGLHRNMAMATWFACVPFPPADSRTPASGSSTLGRGQPHSRDHHRVGPARCPPAPRHLAGRHAQGRDAERLRGPGTAGPLRGARQRGPARSGHVPP